MRSPLLKSLDFRYTLHFVVGHSDFWWNERLVHCNPTARHQSKWKSRMWRRMLRLWHRKRKKKMSRVNKIGRIHINNNHLNWTTRFNDETSTAEQDISSDSLAPIYTFLVSTIHSALETSSRCRFIHFTPSFQCHVFAAKVRIPSRLCLHLTHLKLWLHWSNKLNSSIQHKTLYHHNHTILHQ